MPRGKYDRKESRIHRLEAELAEASKKLKDTKDELEKTSIELRSTKKLAEVASKIPAAVHVMPAEKFTVLRDNLKTLSEARRVLVDSDQVASNVLGQIDEEITAHLRLLGALRSDSFRGEEQSAQMQTAPIPVPLPTAVPPFFASGPSFRSVKSVG